MVNSSLAKVVDVLFIVKVCLESEVFQVVDSILESVVQDQWICTKSEVCLLA